MSDMTPMEEIRAERQRQIEVEGWTPEHDDEHNCEEMRVAAWCYYANASRSFEAPLRDDGAPVGWPWAAKWWKPKDKRCDLIRAGALCLAEIERLERAGEDNLTHMPKHLLYLILKAMERQP